MVQWTKPLQQSENLIDLSTKSGAAGRAANRLARAEKLRREKERMEAEAIAQAMKLRQRRPR